MTITNNQPAPAPLPGDDGVMCARLLFACTGHPHALIPWPHRLLHDAVAHISDLTRRLAEAEAERDSLRKRYDAMHEHMCALDSVFDDAIDTLRKETPNARTSQEEADARDMAEAFAALKGIAQAALAATDVKP